MSTLRALARVQALAAGRAQPIATVRHLHLADRPLVLVPLTLAGEANAPLALLAGTDPATPRLLVVPQPRNRDLRTAFHLELAEILLPYLEPTARSPRPSPTDRGRDVRHRYVDAPQILLPNSAGITFLRLLGRATRFAETEGEYAVPAGGAAARALADLPRRTGRAPGFGADRGADRGARPALGHRSEQCGGSAPARPAGLDRPARRHAAATSRPAPPSSPRPPARPPTRSSTTRCSPR